LDTAPSNLRNGTGERKTNALSFGLNDSRRKEKICGSPAQKMKKERKKNNRQQTKTQSSQKTVLLKNKPPEME
jgi:hypothetical protein